MFIRIDDFAAEWTSEAEMTASVLDVLTDASLKQTICEGRRTLGQIAWHLVKSPHYMTTLGLEFDAPQGGDEAPASAALIASEYRRISQALLHAVRTQWNDGTLLESVTIQGEEWPNGGSLRFTLMHQAHHRGQMTVLMRQAGLRLPEVYGPTYDTWIDKGVAPLV
ncbi:DinB family protein [Cohnella lupini]|uniref:Putative damage-inducible protein DinB n=1 Tax=Cohnella lupini TaxID=1294267 RepID=A0A3D9IA89_9BACL|nr:DinB family protein [Cohnella lupini]RED58580.1 putative damage-inducible protein DinB [Cohnella lupini]